MNNFVNIGEDGRFYLDGARWMCNSTVYFGRFPGTCATDWLREDHWQKNEPEIDRDFENMARIGLNHVALFFHNDAFFENGKLLENGFSKVDRLVEAAKRNGLRISLFVGGFIDSPEVFQQITGQAWTHDNQWLPSFNPALFEAYVAQMQPFATRYQNEPTVLAYTDRIDRFHKGFDNVAIPFNLKDEWAQHLKTRFGTFENLREAVGGEFENNARDWNDVLLPQESAVNASLENPLGYEYILWQKQSIGEAHSRFDAAVQKLAPHQFVWTPFEGNTNTWAMLDGFSPETKKLHAIWMEYYFFEMTRTSYVQPFEEWPHTREVVHHRLSHNIPIIYTAAYIMARYLKLSTQRPVVLCHGGWVGNPAYGIDTEEQQAAIVDRVNAACLAADADGWHYWDWRDDNQAWMAHTASRKKDPTAFYFYGESLGLHEFDGTPRPVVSLVRQYSREVQRRENAPHKKSDVLLLSSAPRMYSLFRRLALPTAGAVAGALTRLGVETDVLWSAQNAIQISDEVLGSYKIIALADNMYERDFREMPTKLLRYVENGGVLYFALHRFDSFRDERGVEYSDAALRRLSGVDEKRAANWPGANTPCVNWPYPTDASQEPNLDVQAFPRLAWGVCPEFRTAAPYAEKLELLGFRSLDGDLFTPLPALVESAEVIAVGKFPAGTRPFIYRHRIGAGTIYVNTWTNNVFRDSPTGHDHGHWDYDWILDLPLQESGARDINLIGGAALWLRNTWGYFGKEKR